MPNPKTTKLTIAMDGPATLEVQDVFAMMQPSFWKTGRLTAARDCALVALLACCHILPGFARHIRLSDWRPEERDVVRLRRFGKWQTVPLTDQVILVVERYIVERNRVLAKLGLECEFLFIRSAGTPIYRDTSAGWQRLRRRIRAQVSIDRMLKNFCVRHLQKWNHEAASRRFRGYVKVLVHGAARLPEVPEEKIIRLLNKHNPFKELRRHFYNEETALRWLARKTLTVRSQLTVKRETLTVPFQLTVRKKTLPLQHPLVIKLLKLVWPQGKAACGHLRARLWEDYGEEIDKELRAGVFSFWHVARLLHTTETLVESHVWTHWRGSRHRSIRYRKPNSSSAYKSELSEEAKNAISAIAQPLPADSSQAANEIKQRLIDHFPTLNLLIKKRLMTAKEVANLFQVDFSRISLLRAAAKVGLTADQILLRRPLPMTDALWDQVRRAHVKRPVHDSPADFFCRLVTAGFEGPYRHVLRFCQQNPIVRAALTEPERSIVDELKSKAWPTGRHELNEQRELMIRRHLVEIDRLVLEGKLDAKKSADLMNLPYPYFHYYREGLKAGLTIDQLLETPKQPTMEMRKLVRREHELTPDEPDMPFYFRMRLTLGFPGGLDTMKTFRASLRSTEALLAPLAESRTPNAA